MLSTADITSQKILHASNAEAEQMQCSVQHSSSTTLLEVEAEHRLWAGYLHILNHPVGLNHFPPVILAVSCMPHHSTGAWALSDPSAGLPALKRFKCPATSQTALRRHTEANVSALFRFFFHFFFFFFIPSFPLPQHKLRIKYLKYINFKKCINKKLLKDTAGRVTMGSDPLQNMETLKKKKKRKPRKQ